MAIRKGCFIQSVIVSTILVAVIVYLIQYKLDDWIIGPGKKLVLNEIAKNWDTETAYIKESAEKDSLKSLLDYYLNNIKTAKEVVNLEKNKFFIEFSDAIEDSLISEKEISQLSLILKEEENEKSKSN